MSCYTRHLAEFLPADPSAADKRALDEAIRGVLDMASADCPDVWEEVKVRREDPHFVTRVEELAARRQQVEQVNSPQSPSSGTGGL